MGSNFVVNWQFRWSHKIGALAWLVGLSKYRMHHLIIEKMSRTETVTPAPATRIVEVGVTLVQAQAVAQAERMMFALDIGSRDSCTIGGTLFTNAGAILC